MKWKFKKKKLEDQWKSSHSTGPGSWINRPAQQARKVRSVLVRGAVSPVLLSPSPAQRFPLQNEDPSPQVKPCPLDWGEDGVPAPCSGPMVLLPAAPSPDRSAHSRQNPESSNPGEGTNEHRAVLRNGCCTLTLCSWPWVSSSKDNFRGDKMCQCHTKKRNFSGSP